MTTKPTDIFWAVLLTIGAAHLVWVGVRSILRTRKLRRLGCPPEIVGPGTEIGIIAGVVAALWLAGAVFALTGGA